MNVDRDLAPGRPPETTRRLFEAAGLIVPEEFIEWFAWRNGSAWRANRVFTLPRFEFWNIATVLRRRRAQESDASFGTEEWQWHPEWLQILGDNNGVAMASDKERAQPPRIRSLLISEFNTSPAYTRTQVVSLCTIVSFWLDDLGTGVQSWNSDTGHWDVRFSEIPKWRRSYA